MTAFAHFGDAIHIAFPLITKGINPHEMTLSQVKTYIERSPIGHHIIDAEQAFFARVQLCWKYIYNMIAQADDVLEVDIPLHEKSSRRTLRQSDVVLVKRGIYYVIEIKSRPPLHKFTGKKRAHHKWKLKKHATQQIAENVRRLHLKGIPAEKIRTFIVYIDNETSGPLHIEKNEIPCPKLYNSA